MLNMDVSIAKHTTIESEPRNLTKSVNLEIPRPKPIIEHIVPEKWFCLVGKCSVFRDYEYQSAEMFINFEWSERVDDPSTELLCTHSGHEHSHDEVEYEQTGSTRPGEHHYRIPYVLEREHNSQETKIFDFVVGRKAMRWARKQTDYLNVLIQTAIEAIEETYQEKVDRESITLAQNIDYKFGPNSTPSPVSSTDSSNPSPIQSYFNEYLERKIDTLEDTTRLHTATTGLTDSQKKLLQRELNPVNCSPCAFSFVQIEFEKGFHQILKMAIPKTKIVQNERCITIFQTIPNDPLTTSSIKWNIARDIPRNESSKTQELDQVKKEESLLGDIFELVFVSNGVEHAFCISLYADILIRTSYATFSGQSAVFVLQKKNVATWPSIVRLESSL